MNWFHNAELTNTAFISSISAAIALSSATATVWFARANLKRELLNQDLNLMASEIKYFEDFRKWADQVVDALTEAIHLCDLQPEKIASGEPYFVRRHRLLISLSALIDKGRWFFPNLEIDDHGAEHELGYRGYRHEVLDGLVSAYRCMKRMDYKEKENNRNPRNELTAWKRHFVGRVQKVLDPDSRQSEWKRIRSKGARRGVAERRT